MQDLLKIVIIFFISSICLSRLNARNSIDTKIQDNEETAAELNQFFSIKTSLIEIMRDSSLYLHRPGFIETNDTIASRKLNPEHSEFEDSCQVKTIRKTAEVNEINQIPGTFRVYPNPANDFINIYFTSEEAEPISIEVRNVQGQTLITRNDIYRGYPLRIISREFNPGIYIISLKTSMGDIHRRIIKE